MGKKKKSKKFIAFAALFIFIAMIFLILNCMVYPVICEYAEAYAGNMTTTAVNKAVLDVFGEGVGYGDLVIVHTDNEGNVQYIEANAARINYLAQKTAQKSKIQLDSLGGDTLKIPIGSLTKSPLFTGYGPDICVKILTAGSVICRFKSHFSTAGINQTIHKIYIEVCANMDIVLPSWRRNISRTVEVYVAESVIAGGVPDTFLNFGAFDKINFIP
jgi:sporulation protein YunB